MNLIGNIWTKFTSGLNSSNAKASHNEKMGVSPPTNEAQGNRDKNAAKR